MNQQETDQVNRIIFYMRKWNLVNYIINDDLSVSVDEDVYIDDSKVSEIPVNFREINGNLRIDNCNFINLKGLPDKLENLLIANCRNLESLQGCTKEISNNFTLRNSSVDSLKYGPVHVGGKYHIDLKKITNLHYLATQIGELCLDDCNITTLDTNGVVCIVDDVISICDTPLSRILFDNKIPYCYNYESAGIYRLPGEIMKYSPYILDMHGNIDISIISDLILEIKEGLK